jgi:hypothetical protein
MHRIWLNHLTATVLVAAGVLSPVAARAQQITASSLPGSSGPVSSGSIQPSSSTEVNSSAYLSASALPDDATEPFSSSAEESDDQANGSSTSAQQQTVQPANRPPIRLKQSPTDPYSPAQTKRILGVIPNFRAVSADVKLPPQSVKEKFITASQDSFDYSSTVIPALLAAYDYGINSVPQFGTGGVAFGRYLWHTTVDQTDENYMVEFIVPVITHEDTRYYTLGHGSTWKRTEYALSRAVITRSDSGKEVFNAGEIVGAGAAAGISNLYYPAPQRTLSDTVTGWGLNVGIDAATFVFKEFWPDIDHKLFHDSE